MTNSLDGWFKAIKESGKQEERKDKEFNEDLQPPDAILIINDCEYGYWKTGEGIMRIRKLKNGYDQHSCYQISNKEFKILEEVYYK